MWHVSVFSVLLLQAQPGSPAPASSVADDPDIIIITGERLEQSLAETASSVAVLTGEDMARSGADRADDLLDLVPNIYTGVGGQGPSVRGQDTTGATRALPAFLGGVRPRMAMTIDGREANYYEFVFGALPLWDVQQVEVFRTPQTVSRGRNSIAGAVHLITKDPTFDWEASLRGAVGDFDLGSASLSLSGPVAGDDVAFRLSLDGRWSRPISEMRDIGTTADRDRDEHQLARLKLLIAPSGLPNFQARVSVSRTKSFMPQLEGVEPPFKKRTDPNAGYGNFDIEIDAVTAEAEWHPDPALHFDLVVAGTRGDVERIAPEGLGQAKSDLRDGSIELTAKYDSGPIRLLGGLHLARLRQIQDIDVSLLVGIAHYREHRYGSGYFAQVQADLGTLFTVEAGLRYQIDRHRRIGGFEGVPQLDLDVDLKEDFLLPRAAITVHLGEKWTAGILGLKATNAGGYLVPISLDEPNRFEREWLWDAEAFVRGSFDGGRGSIELNAFNYWFRDFQRSEARPVDILGVPEFLILAKVINIPKAESRGAELSAHWTSGRWSLRGGLGYLDTEFTDVTGTNQIEEGNEFARSPHWTGNLGVNAAIGSGWSIDTSFRGYSKLYSDDRNRDSGRVQGAVYVDVQVEKRAGPLRIFAQVRNLFDRFEITYFDSPELAVAADPRTALIGIASDF